ncbi:hypothetical protein ATO6_02705 [Oceanicola sp. 22II-s10i]|nr:hypothetical protein ATO6_02705 [Oceanicola sp. 22II-s10i]
MAVAAFGAALILWIMPAHTETVSSGWITPQTLPRACGIALIGLGLWLAVFPGGKVEIDGKEAALCALVAAVSAAGVWGMGRFGFLFVAPVLAATLVAIIGERRWPWIVAGIAAAPVSIWLLVPVLLGRPLP